MTEVDCYRKDATGESEWGPLYPKDLVPGDIITVRGGDAIPADCEYFSGPEIAVRYPCRRWQLVSNSSAYPAMQDIRRVRSLPSFHTYPVYTYPV